MIQSGKKDKAKKGPVIPAGTEQETGLTRGQTEKPLVKKPKPGKKIQTGDLPADM